MLRQPTDIRYFTRDRRRVVNPYMGFSTFQHYRGDPLYSDIVVDSANHGLETEERECYPVPSYIEQQGDRQGFYPDCSVAYIRILWKEFEPRRREYRYEVIEEVLRRAKAAGQTVLFRLLPHSTRESDDVPDWLKERIDCPARPAGMRVKDSPADPVYLRYFGEAIARIGERFDADPTLDMLDISITGSWGEGYGCDRYPREALQELMDVYTRSFTHTRLIGQIAAPWLIEYGGRNRPIGWRADGLGSDYLTYIRYPAVAEQLQDNWKTAPVLFESYWWLEEWQRQGWDIDDMIDRTLRWHITGFNAKSMPIPFAWRDKIDRWLDSMGYHFVVRVCRFPAAAAPGDTLAIQLTVENAGVAPLYTPVPLRLRLVSDRHTYAVTTAVDVRRWLPGDTVETVTLPLPADAEPGTYSLEMGLGGGDAPAVQLEMQTDRDGEYSRLATVTIRKEETI